MAISTRDVKVRMMGSEVSYIGFRSRDDTSGGIHFKQTQTFTHEISTIS